MPNRPGDDLKRPRRSRGRDESVRRVSRVTRAVGVVAVLGTVVAGGLAATGRGPSPATTRTAEVHRSPAVASGTVVGRATRPVVRRVVDDDAPPVVHRRPAVTQVRRTAVPAPVVRRPVVRAPVAPPAPVVQAPVASSGGS